MLRLLLASPGTLFSSFAHPNVRSITKLMTRAKRKAIINLFIELLFVMAYHDDSFSKYMA